MQSRFNKAKNYAFLHENAPKKLDTLGYFHKEEKVQQQC